MIKEKELLKGIGTVLLYFGLQIVLSIPFSYLYNKHILSLQIDNILLYISIALIFIILYRKSLIKDFKNINKDIFKITIKYWLIGLSIMITSSIIISILGIDNNINQENNYLLLKEMPVFELIGAILLAPIIEEITFRLSFKKSFNNKNLFAIITGILFGLIHVLSSIDTLGLISFIYLIPYSAVGIAFGYAYTKTNNIYGTMLVHSLHNTISILLLIIGGNIL